jgi:hypothetical protein
LRSVSAKEFTIGLGRWYSPGDEDAFFVRLRALRCVKSYEGRCPSDLHVVLSKAPSEMELRELIALLCRYDLDMKPLAAFRTKRNAAWFFENRQAFWHGRVFGKSKPKRSN